jgi:3-isopropylmalate dehydrogenase
LGIQQHYSNIQHIFRKLRKNDPIASILSAAMLLEHFGLHWNLRIESSSKSNRTQCARQSQLTWIRIRNLEQISWRFIASPVLSKDDLYFKDDEMYIWTINNCLNKNKFFQI